MKKQEAFNPMNCDEEEIDQDRDYSIMELHLCHATRYDGGTVHIIHAFCPHCFIEINERSDFIGSKTRDGHKLSVNKESMSFTCPAHGGWITTVKREKQVQKSP